MNQKISLVQISEYLNECIDMRRDIPEEVVSEFVFQLADKATVLPAFCLQKRVAKVPLFIVLIYFSVQYYL